MIENITYVRGSRGQIKMSFLFVFTQIFFIHLFILETLIYIFENIYIFETLLFYLFILYSVFVFILRNVVYSEK